MDHIPEADPPAVSDAARAVVRDAKTASVWIFGGGLFRQQASYVAPDGASPRPVPETKAVVGWLLHPKWPRARTRWFGPARLNAATAARRKCADHV